MSNEKNYTPAEIADEELKGVSGGTDEVVADGDVLVDMYYDKVDEDGNTCGYYHHGYCPNCGKWVVFSTAEKRRCPHCKTVWDNIFYTKE